MTTADEFKVRHIDATSESELEQVVTLANRAYRAEGGWTTEKHLVSGLRSTLAELKVRVPLINVQILVLTTAEENNVVGCIEIARADDESSVIGFLAVAQEYQSRGLGGRLMAAAERFAQRSFNSRVGRMSVISAREDVQKWYKKLGYEHTGESRTWLDITKGRIDSGGPLVDFTFLTFEKKFEEPLFTVKRVESVTDAQLERLVSIINEAYRGQGGWNTKGHVKGGVRTTNAALRERLTLEHVRFLVLVQDTPAVSDDDKEAGKDICGCAEVSMDDGSATIGLIAVDPTRQSLGIGSRLLYASERVAHSDWQVSATQLIVNSLRTDIASWYVRQGYTQTGERLSWEQVTKGDIDQGRPTDEVWFIRYEKML